MGREIETVNNSVVQQTRKLKKKLVNDHMNRYRPLFYLISQIAPGNWDSQLSLKLSKFLKTFPKC